MVWVQIVMAVVQMAMSMKQASDQQKAAQKQAQQQIDQQSKQQWDQFELNEKERKEQLKRTLAQKRARMGASGFSAADGSAGAILQGLRNDTAEDSYEEYSDRKEALDNSVAGIQADLLEQSKQAKRKLYSQMGASVGSIGGGMMGGSEWANVGGQAGGMAGGMLGGS